MFSVLRLVLAKNARNAGVQASLADFIFRDTLQFLVAVHSDHGRNHVLENLKTYIEVVHHEGYTSDSLSCKSALTFRRYLQSLIRNLQMQENASLPFCEMQANCPMRHSILILFLLLLRRSSDTTSTRSGYVLRYENLFSKPQLTHYF